MNEITCRDCGRYESECTCNVPTIDKDTQIIELQERIKELEETALTKDELKRLCDDYDNRYGAYPESEFEGEAVYEFILAKLQKIIDKRGCNED